MEKLCPRHVFIRVEDEEAIHAALQTLSYRVRPRLKPGIGRRRLGISHGGGSGGSHLFRSPSDDEYDDDDWMSEFIMDMNTIKNEIKKRKTDYKRSNLTLIKGGLESEEG